MRSRSLLAAALLALIVPLAACGGDDTSTATDEPDTSDTSSSAAAEEEGPCTDATDLLAEVCDAGVLTVSTDPAYPPASSLNEQTGEYEGFDIDVATEIAERLGVDVAGRRRPGTSSRPAAGTAAGTPPWAR